MLDKIGNMDVDDDLYDTLLRIIWVLYGELTEKLAKLDADLLRNNIAIENMQKQTLQPNSIMNCWMQLCDTWKKFQRIE